MQTITLYLGLDVHKDSITLAIAPAGRLSLSLSPLSRIYAEENHRWTQMNTDSWGRAPVLLRFALGHRSVNGLSPCRSVILSSSYLCLSVSICGCIELFRLRGRGCRRRERGWFMGSRHELVRGILSPQGGERGSHEIVPSSIEKWYNLLRPIWRPRAWLHKHC
jgi:hypothetical protein